MVPPEPTAAPRSAAGRAVRVAAPLAAGLPLLATAAVSWAGSQALVRPGPGRPRPHVKVTPLDLCDAAAPDPALADWLPAPLAALPVSGVVRLDRPAPALLRVEVDDGPPLLLAPPWPFAADRRTAQRGAQDPSIRVVLAAAPPAAQVRGRVDSYLFDTPADAGLRGETLTLATGDAEVDGWVARPDGDEGPAGTWAVFVHGRRAGVAQGLRLARAFAAAGIPTVALPHYAGDRPDSRRCGLGGAEWPHVEAAVRWAVRAGARRVILAGASMGAAVVTSLLRRSDVAPLVSGLVFDSPVLDWATVVRAAARAAGVPVAAAAPVLALSAWRARLDWADVSLLADPPREPLPTLILHGTEDAVTPLASSEQLAALLPDRATLETFEGAGHVHSYNAAPGRYEDLVAAFARALTQQPEPTAPPVLPHGPPLPL
jgi:pimeloyl-ACP methyl ester carboxylesterase